MTGKMKRARTRWRDNKSLLTWFIKLVLGWTALAVAVFLIFYFLGK